MSLCNIGFLIWAPYVICNDCDWQDACGYGRTGARVSGSAAGILPRGCFGCGREHPLRDVALSFFVVKSNIILTLLHNSRSTSCYSCTSRGRGRSIYRDVDSQFSSSDQIVTLLFCCLPTEKGFEVGDRQSWSSACSASPASGTPDTCNAHGVMLVKLFSNSSASPLGKWSIRQAGGRGEVYIFLRFCPQKCTLPEIQFPT